MTSYLTNAGLLIGIAYAGAGLIVALLVAWPGRSQILEAIRHGMVTVFLIALHIIAWPVVVLTWLADTRSVDSAHEDEP